MSSTITVKIQSVSDILSNSNLQIPDYQRPYKWERRHIRNLFYDICEAVESKINEYRLGSIILHDNNDFLDIVDGQQRLISLSLFLYQIKKHDEFAGAKELLECKQYLTISRKHAKENLEEWDVLCKSIEEDKYNLINKFIIEKCKFSVITMPSNKLPEAFQLFDSQNNRGKPLDPHDLLKAYHLRAIKEPTEQTIKKWEQYVKDDELSLANLFDKHLFRVRRWANGDTGLYKKKHGSELRFSELFIDDFKGDSIDNGKYPYLQLYKLLKDKNIEFPNSLCMPIINGENFFKYIEYAYDLLKKKKKYWEGIEIYNIINNKSKHQRVINLYENLIALFIDRFGKNELNREVREKIFIWAFYPRINAVLIYDSTIANYAAGGMFRREAGYQRLFQKLSVSATPREFISNIDMDKLENYSYEQMYKKICEEYK